VKECSAVNDNSHMNETIQSQHMMNFVPGHYGDNFYGWWADWFYPAMNLLQSTPIIPGRGNHEICTRGGFGFFLFMFPYDIDDGSTNYCLDNYPPYAVRFEHEQFLVMDDSIINPLRGGVDHYMNTLEGCPGTPEDGQPLIVPKRENRYLDPKNAEETEEQVELFTKWFKDIEFLSLDRETNFYVGHRPVLGIGCNYTDVVTLDWTLQQSLTNTTFDRISALITGHMHWLEVLEFEDNVLPAQMVVGNGGTMMIENKIDQSSIPYINLTVGKEEYGIHGRVKRGITKSAFGYGIMERQDDLSYEVKFMTWQADKGSVANQFNLTIPAGLRKNAQTDATEDGDEPVTMQGGNVIVSSGDIQSRLSFIVGAFFVIVYLCN